MTRIKKFVLDIIGDTIRLKAIFFSSFVFLLLICSALIILMWNTAIKDSNEQALRLASVAAAGFETEEISVLELNETDLKKPQYIEIKDSLKNIVEHHKEIQFAYIYAMKNDKVYFMADSEPENSKDYSPPGQEYTEISDADKQPFFDGKDVITYGSDRWGTWYSVLIPMRDKETDEVIAIFGFDYTPEMWVKTAVTYTMQMLAMCLSLIIIYIFIFFLFRKNAAIRREQVKLLEANKKISEQEILFRTVFEQSPLGFALNIGGVDEQNPAYERIVGRTKEEIKKLGWEAYTHPDDLEQELEFHKRLINGETINYSKRYIKPDESIVWVNLTIAPIIIGEKSEWDYLCIIEDITERIKAEKDRKESERSYSILLSNLPGMAYRCKYDPNWTMLFVSDGCEDLTGYESSDLCENSQVTYSELINPEYRDYLWERWKDAISAKTILKEEYEIKTASGESKWVFEQGQPIFDEEGNVEALEGLIVDITDRKRKEEEILYLNNHDYLTGIYNRQFLETEKSKLDREDCLPLSILIGDINGLKLVNDAFGHMQGDRLIQKTAEIIKSCCRESDIVARTGGDEFSVLLPRTDAVSADKLIEKIKLVSEGYNNNLQNEAFSINISLGFATKVSMETEIDECIKNAEDYMYKRKLLEHKSSHSVILSSIKATMHAKSHETQEHAERLTCIAKEIGKKMKLNQQELDELELVATLHDIGKVGIEDRILNKPARLNDEEWSEMKKHSEIGYRIAMSSPDLVPIADYILSLHERWDGTGYPQGIKGESIPLLSRIVSIVDAFDAMTQDRAYRKAMPEEKAAREIKENAGTQFDPKIAKLFLEKVLPNFILNEKKEMEENQ